MNPTPSRAALCRPGRTPLTASALLLSFASLALGLTGCERASTAPPAPQPTINGTLISFPGQKDPEGLRTAEVVASAEQPLLLPGRLAWDDDATARVYPPFAGRVLGVQAQVGQNVAKGAVLAVISAAEYGQAQADARRAQADERLARQQLDRASSLLEVGAVARKHVEAAQAEHERAQADLQRAQARLEPYSTNAATPASPTGRNAIHQSLTITSPVAGVVVERQVNPGLELRPDSSGAPLFLVSDPSRLWAVMDLDETQLARVHPGEKLALSTAAWPDDRFEAVVEHVAKLVDPESRTIKLRARVDNRSGKLRAEMFVQARLSLDDGRARVPADAVFVRGEQLGVFVAQGPGRYERRFVKLRPAGPQWWLVDEGLKPGEQVVVGAALFLNQMLDAAR